jgi:hypothetical protein
MESTRSWSCEKLGVKAPLPIFDFLESPLTKS